MVNDVRLNDLTRLGAFAHDLVDGWIALSRNTKHTDTVVMTYSRSTQFRGHWVEDTTLLARGLVLRFRDGAEVDALVEAIKNHDTDTVETVLRDAVVKARAMRKFFTIEASNSDWGRVQLRDDDEDVTVNEDYKIDYDSPVIVSDKLDGALGICTVIDDDIIISTKGNFNSLEAKIGTRVLHVKHDADAFRETLTTEYAGFTPLFEIITPKHKHIVDYGDMEDIVFLGLVHNATGHWVPAGLLDEDVFTKGRDTARLTNGFTVPEVYTARNLGEALRMAQPDNHEGIVITLLNGHDGNGLQDMFKLKYADYYKIRYVRGIVEKKSRIRELVKNMTIEEITNRDTESMRRVITSLLRNANGNVRKHAERFIDETIKYVTDTVIDPINELTDDVLEKYETLMTLEPRDKKEYVSVLDLYPKKYEAFLLSAYNAASSGIDPREYVTRTARKHILRTM